MRRPILRLRRVRTRNQRACKRPERIDLVRSSASLHFLKCVSRRFVCSHLGLLRRNRTGGFQMKIAIFLVLLALAFSIYGQESGKTDIERIRNAALSDSKVMEQAFWLSDVHGPRLTGSPNFRAAGTWAEERLREYGVQVNEEPINHFGDGWWCDQFEMSLLTPTFARLSAAPVAWSNATPGRVVGDVVRFDMPKSPNEFDSFVARYRGKIRNTLLLVDAAKLVPFEPQLSGKRLSDNDLVELSTVRPQATDANRKPGGSPGAAQRPANNWRELLVKFMHDEGVLAMVSPGSLLNNGGAFTVEAAGFGPGPVPPDVPPIIVMSREHYDRLVRLAEHGIKTTVSLESSTHFVSDTPNAFSVVGGISGSRKPDEIVMIGAHLDSWASGTGATDDAAGCAIIIEAFRLLKSLGLRLDRTVRLALWGGEEQGLRGSSAYVRKHFVDSETGRRMPEYDKLSAYFNLDSGTGKVRGIFSGGDGGVCS